jgi:hypothetical protein
VRVNSWPPPSVTGRSPRSDEDLEIADCRQSDFDSFRGSSRRFLVARLQIGRFLYAGDPFDFVPQFRLAPGKVGFIVVGPEGRVGASRQAVRRQHRVKGETWSLSDLG